MRCHKELAEKLASIAPRPSGRGDVVALPRAFTSHAWTLARWQESFTSLETAPFFLVRPVGDALSYSS